MTYLATPKELIRYDGLLYKVIKHSTNLGIFVERLVTKRNIKTGKRRHAFVDRGDFIPSGSEIEFYDYKN